MNAPPCRSCTLGLDLGTSSCKAALVDPSGRPIASVSRDYPTHCPQPGWAEQDPADWWAAACQASRALMAHPDAQGCQVRAIGLTCAAHIGVLLDESLRPIRRAILWSDLRAASQAVRLQQEAGALILHQSGQAPSPGWTLAHLAWLAEHEPDAHRRIRHLLLSKDHLAFLLTGRMATDRASAVSAQLHDATADRWSAELAAMAKLPLSALPPVIDATSAVGSLLPEPARAMGLPAGIPVITGSLDSATELLSAGCVSPGQAMIRLASAGGLQQVTATIMRHPLRITYPHVGSAHWYVQAGTSACAAAVGWGKRLLAPQSSWDQLEQAASQAPAGCDGLVFHPYLQGERAPYWNADLKAGYTGLTLAHDARHLLRAIYEGTAYSIRDAMRVLDDLPSPTPPLKVVGGGSRQKLWVTILASVLDRPLLPMPHVDSALGAGWLAWASLELGPAATTDPGSDPILPDPGMTAIYQQGFKAYRQIAQDMLLAIDRKKVPLPSPAGN